MNNNATANALKLYERSYFLNAPSYFVYRTGTFPSMINYSNVNYRELYEELKNEYKLDSSKCVSDKRYNRNKRTHLLTSMIIQLSENLMINISSGKISVEVLYNSEVIGQEISRLEKIIVKHIKPEIHQQMVGVIADDNYSQMEVKYFPVTNTIQNINSFYNDDFLEFDKLIKQRIRVKNSKGLILLHGDIGSGKTSYIRHLISSSNTLKNFIFLPMELSHRINQPAFLTFLLKNATNSILVIEDAEQLLLERKVNAFNAVPILLNLTDGILADVLNIQVIATFNAELGSIDPALLRRGRLITKYKFGPLAIDKANALMSICGIEHKANKPMTLAEIFNHQEKDYTTKTTKSSIGYINQPV